jgi:hypothetical protein
MRMPGVEAPAVPASATSAPAVAAPTNTTAPAVLPTATQSAPEATVPPPTAAPPTTVVTLPADTPAAEQAAVQPSATQPPPTATPVPEITFDPYTDLGDPTYENPMEFPNLWEWKSPEEDELPNNNRLRLRFDDGKLRVTGKRSGFSTWWFSGHTLSDAFVEMTFDTLDCSGDDAYGIILRGPKHLAGESYGYVVSFTCDGRLWVFRLDSGKPFDIESLEENDIDAIDTGADEENVIGVRAEGDEFIVYANGVQVAEFEDDEFEKGRVGVFVQAAGRGAYTYKVTNFAFWDLEEED